MHLARNETSVETRHCLSDFHEALVQTRFSQTELTSNLCLAGTSKKAPCMSLIFSRTIKDDLIGVCNDVKASIADRGSQSTSVLISDNKESEANTKGKPNLNLH